MKNLSGRSRLLFALAIVLTMTLLFFYYDRTRGHLAPRSREDRLKQVHDLAQSPRDYPQGSRQLLTAAREFFLDYPGAHDQELKLSIAYATSAQSDADWLFVADTMEEVALHVLADVKGVPKQQEFEKAGFHFEQYYGGWPKPFLVTDIDGDGSPDVLMATPGIGPSVCFLFRHTKQGWVSTRLGVGVPVMGLWAFDITPHGPKAIAIACLADSEYNPNMLFDVFAWQPGRLTNVLSTIIRHGWQWEHKDRDGNGVQSLRLVEYPKELALWSATSHNNILYRWDGSRFVLQSTSLKPHAVTTFTLQQGEDLYETGRYREAEATLEAALKLKPDPNDSYSEPAERQTAHYVIGLCRALLGDEAGAHQEMLKAGAAQAGTPTKTLAQRFLDATMQPGRLPEGLAAVGQVFPLLALSAQSAGADATPKTLLAAVHLRPDVYREAALTGPGASEVLTQFAWSGGNAVVVWRRDPQTQRWMAWPLAYGLSGNKPTQQELYQLPIDFWFSLPHASALQTTPTPISVQLMGVTSDNPPQIEISYRRDQGTQNGAVAWNGQEFVTTRPAPTVAENLEAELNGIEARLFEQRDYRTTLKELEEMEAHISASARSSQDKVDLRLEVYYHQALCYRKLGDTRHAEVILAALQRSYPDSDWGRLATAWLNGSGLPHDNLQLPYNLQPRF